MSGRVSPSLGGSAFPHEGPAFAIIRRLLKYIALDLGAAEEIVRRTSLDWTIARPPRLITGSGEQYRAARDSLPNVARSMSFRAVAAFMLDAIEKRSHVHEIVGLGGPPGNK